MKFGLKGKLISGFLFAGLVPMLVVGSYTYIKSKSDLEKQATERLNTIRDMSKRSIERYLHNIESQVSSFARNDSTKDAMRSLSESYPKMLDDNEYDSIEIEVFRKKLMNYYRKANQNSFNAKSFLSSLSELSVAHQYHYIASNEHKGDKAHEYMRASDKSDYSSHHALYHGSIGHFMDSFGYDDVTFIDTKGEVVYSAAKKFIFGTSLTNGLFKDSGLARAYSGALNLSENEKVYASDFSQYAASYNQPSAFIAAPVKDGERVLGVVAFQLSAKALGHILSDRTGLGETGETFIVGYDKKMRTDSYLSEQHSVQSSFSNPDKGSVDTLAVNKGLAGHDGSLRSSDYLGQESLISFTPISFMGRYKWVLVSKISAQEALVAASDLEMTIGALFIVVCLGIFGLAYYVSNTISVSIKSVAQKLFAGAEEVAKSSDHVSATSGELSNAATESAASLQETVASIDEISSMIQRNADSANSSTKVSSKSTEAAMRGKETVQEMIGSINEIAESNDEISHIVEVISEIGEKTKVINDIVFQTKLLSINASVEAARAGEHGKGFAVVAEEVGNLAAVSGKAALDITTMLDASIKQVTDIVDKTKRRVDTGTQTAKECGEALDQIITNVSMVNDMVKEIASASVEQSTGVREVTTAMQELDQTTHKNTTVAQESSAMATKLKEQADYLNSGVSELLAIVGGDHNVRHEVSEARPISHDKPQSDNVLDLPIREHKKEGEAEHSEQKSNDGIKVAGLDTVIPKSDDPRFEDL